MKKLEKKLRVGILGGTGMVGQRFITLLENHPWFEVTTIAASSRSAGKTYEEAMSGRWKLEDKMPEAVKNIVVKDVKDIEEISNSVDFVFSAVDMTKEEIKAIEDEYAKSETPVVSNNSAHRWTEDVPMVVPEINIDHYQHLQHGRNLNHTKYALQHIRLFQVPERTSQIGQKWLETSPLTLVEKKKRVKSNHLRFWDQSRTINL